MSEFVETNYEAAGEAAALSGSMDQPTTMSQGTFYKSSQISCIKAVAETFYLKDRLDAFRSRKAVDTVHF